MVTIDLSIGSTETKFTKLNTKTQNIFCCLNEHLTTLLYTLKKKTSVSSLPLFKVYKKVVKFSFTQQKIFWVLVFSIRIWYLAYPTDRSMEAESYN